MLGNIKHFFFYLVIYKQAPCIFEYKKVVVPYSHMKQNLLTPTLSDIYMEIIFLISESKDVVI